MYKCKYFKINELVNPVVLKKYGESKCWLLFDPELLQCADNIRERYGKCTVNTPALSDCGLRAWDSSTGASLSAHKFGRALDLRISAIENQALSVKDATVRKKWKTEAYNKTRDELLKSPLFNRLNFENNINWLHIDTFNRPKRLFDA